MLHALEIDILGPLRIRSGSPVAVRSDDGDGITGVARTGSMDPDVCVQIRQGLPRRLLAALALRVGDVVSTDTLIDLLWDQRPRPPRSRTAEVLRPPRRLPGDIRPGRRRRGRPGRS